MVDNITAKANIGAGTEVIATDEIGGVHFPRTKLVIGADGSNDGDVSSANPMPVASGDVGAIADSAATTDTGSFSIIAMIKRGLQNWTTLLARVPANGQAAMAASIPVAIATNQSAVPVSGTFWQATQPVSAASLPLPTGAATETTLAALNTKTPALGQATMANSSPVVIASNQSAVPVSGTLTSAGTTTATPATPTADNHNSAATTNSRVIKASAGTVYRVTASNTNAAARFLKLYNTSSAPTVGTTVPVLTIPIPATGLVNVEMGALGHRFTTGISMALTTGMADSDTAAVAANEIKVVTSYI